MSKARTLANLISDNAELADGQISVAEVVGAAPTASPTFTGNIDAGDNVKIRLGDSDDLQIYHDGNNSYINDAGTGALLVRGSNVVIGKYTGEDMINAFADGRVDLYYDNAIKLTTTSTGVDVTGGFTATDGSTITTSDNTAQLTLISTDADANQGPLLVLDRNSASPADGDSIGTISFNAKNDAAEAHGYAKIEARIVDASNATEDGRLELMTSVATEEGISRILMDATETVINDNSKNLDFRIESDNNSNILFVDASADIVNMGKVFINGTNGPLKIGGSGYVTNPTTLVLGQYTSTRGYIQVPNDGNLEIWDGGTNILAVIGDGGTTFNENSGDRDFRIESNNNANMLFVDAGNDRIGVGTSNPLAVLDIQGNTNAYSTMSKIYLTDVSGHANSRNWSIGNGGSDYGNFTVGVSNAAGGDPQASGTHFNPFLITKEGNVVFNEDSKDADFRVESDAATHAIFVEGSSSYVKIGKSSDATGEKNLGVMIGCEGATSNGRIGSTSNSSSWFSKYGSDGDLIKFHKTDGTNLYNVGSISVTSSGTTYNTTSDRRLKDNIEPIADATDKLMSMKPVTHTWIANPEAPSVHGFIAQEMQEIIPEAVSGEDGGEDMMSMDYGRITPVLVAALQEATNEIKALKQRVLELEEK